MADRSGGRLSDPRVAVALRDLASLKREKTIVLALLIQLFVAAFSSFLVVGLTAMYDPGAVDDAADLTVGVTGDHQEALAVAVADQDGVGVVRFPDRESAMAAFHGDGVQAVLEGSRTATDSGSRIDVRAIAPAENLRTTLIVVQLRRALSTLEDGERDRRLGELSYEPIEPPERTDASPYFGFTYTVLVPLLLFLPAFISGSVAVDAITEEIERGTLELLRVSPLSLVDVVDGKVAGLVLLAPAQVVLWILLLGLNGIAVGNPLALLALVTAMTAIIVLVGVTLGLVTRRRRQAQLLYSTLVLVLFGLAALLPEHPATTIAKLAVESGTALTLAHVGLFVGLAVVATVVSRRFVARVDPERLR